MLRDWKKKKKKKDFFFWFFSPIFFTWTKLLFFFYNLQLNKRGCYFKHSISQGLVDKCKFPTPSKNIETYLFYAKSFLNIYLRHVWRERNNWNEGTLFMSIKISMKQLKQRLQSFNKNVLTNMKKFSKISLQVW